MSSAHAFLQNLALVLGVAALTTVVSQRLRLPVVFGYLLAGMIVGPHIPLPLVADEGMVHALSELGVILLMYSLGLEFRLSRVVRLAGTAGVAALAETGLTFGLGYALATLLGWTARESLFAGAIVAISSTTIIARAFADQQVGGRLREIVFGMLIAEDLIAILLVAVLSAVAAGGGLSPAELGVTAVRLATFLAALVGVGLLTLPRLVRRVVALGRAETTVVTAIGISFAAALLALGFGYSVALGAFIAGSLVAESGEGERVDRLIAPVRDVFVAIFFVAVGMLIDPQVLAAHWPAVLAFTALVVVGKVVAVSLGVFLTGHGLRDGVRAGMSMAQIGEFSFIIAGVGVASGAVRPFVYPVAIAVSAITTLLTPRMVRSGAPAAQWVDRKLPRALQTYAVLYGSWIERLRSAGPPGGPTGVPRLVRLVLLDLALLTGLVIAAAAEMGRGAVLLQRWLGWSAAASRWGVVMLAAAAAVPFAVGLVRTTAQLATQLALRALPSPAQRGLDLAAAPRRALAATLQYALLLAAAVPLMAVLQPFAPRVPAIAVLAVLAVGAGIGVWQSAGGLYGHARAGAEVIVMALSQHDRARGTPDELARTMARLDALLPGLGAPEVVRLVAGSPGVGRTLRALDLRGTTGATVLAIAHLDPDDPTGEVRASLPTGTEPLAVGDVLALAGAQEAIAAARALLAPPAVEVPVGPGVGDGEEARFTVTTAGTGV